MMHRLQLIAAAAVCLAATPATACSGLPFMVTQPMVERFILNSAGTLNLFPRGGDAMASYITILASTSNAATEQIIRLARIASAQQQDALARGLAQAARQCAFAEPRRGRQIERAVRTSNNRRIISGFTTAFRAPQSEPPPDSAAIVAPWAQKSPADRERTSTGLAPPGLEGRIPSIGPIGPVQPNYRGIR